MLVLKNIEQEAKKESILVALPSEKKVDTFMCCDIFYIIIAKLWRNFNSQVYIGHDNINTISSDTSIECGLFYFSNNRTSHTDFDEIC